MCTVNLYSFAEFQQGLGRFDFASSFVVLYDSVSGTFCGLKLHAHFVRRKNDSTWFKDINCLGLPRILMCDHVCCCLQTSFHSLIPRIDLDPAGSETIVATWPQWNLSYSLAKAVRKMTIFSRFWHNKVVQLATSLVCNLLSKFDCQHSSASQFLARIVRWDQKYLSPWLLRFVSPTSSPRRDVDAEDSCSCLSFAGMTIETGYENLRNRQFIPKLE